MSRSVFIRLVFFSLVLTSTLPFALAEPDISAKVEVDRAFATIGDPINFRITVAHAPEINVLEMDPSGVLGDFEIKQATNFSNKENGKVLEGKNYAITTYTLGEYVIKPFTIQYRAGGEIKQLKTSSLYITIESVDKSKDPQTDIRGVKGVLKLKNRLGIWLVILLFLAIGAVASWTFYLRKSRGASGSAEEPALSPHDEAYLALNKLQHSDLIRKGQTKLYFFQMSEILRRYFERRYQIRALESTTHEVTRDLKEKLTVDNAKIVEEALSFCDLVKFAKYDPPPMEILRQNNQAKLIIDRTKEEIQVSLPESAQN